MKNGIIVKPAKVLLKRTQVLLCTPLSIFCLNFLKNTRKPSAKASGHLNLYSSVVHFLDM